MGMDGILTTDNIPDNRFFKTLNYIIKLSVLKNRLSGILSFGIPNISVLSGILSVVDIPSVAMPIPEEIQLLMYGSNL